MRIARFTTGDDPLYGVVAGDLDEYGQPSEDSVIVTLAGDPMYAGVKPLEEQHRLVDVRLLAPVIPRSKVVAIGKQLRGARRRDGQRGAGRAADVPQAEHRRDRPRRPDLLPPPVAAGGLRGRAGRGHRPDLPRRTRRAGDRRDLRLHDRQRRDRARPPEVRRPVEPRQGLRLLLPARPVDRDRPRPARLRGGPPGADLPQRRPQAGRVHPGPDLRHPHAHRPHHRGDDAAARRRDPHRHARGRRSDAGRRRGRGLDRGTRRPHEQGEHQR